MMTVPILPWVVFALILFWFVGARSRLKRLRAAAVQAYTVLDAALRRQLEFVQTQLAAVPPSASWDGSNEAVLRGAATQLSTLLTATRSQPLNVTVFGALVTALHALLAAWQRAHPDETHRFEPNGAPMRPDAGPQADAAALALPPAPSPLHWPEPSAAAEIARNQFNRCIGQYNAAVGQFPVFLVAWLSGLRRAMPLA
jgi:LemA protein